MSRIIITTKTELGDRAVKQHIKEFKKMPFRQKLVFKTAGFRQEVTEGEYTGLILHINNRHTNNKLYLNMLQDQITEGITQNGAEEGVDFSQEIKNE